MTEIIKMAKNKFVLVDEDDYDYLMQWNWHFFGGYAKNAKQGFMHRLLMNPGDLYVDHANGNKLDNRRANLRVCTHSQNMMNRPMSSSNSSGYKGVFFNKQCNKWMSLISANGKSNYLGLFTCKHKAALAYNEAAIKYHGEFATLNQVTEFSN